MSTPTLEDLRQAVRFRLRDFTQKLDEAEIDTELNRQLNKWTRDGNLIQLSLSQDILANSNPQFLVPMPGFEIAEVGDIKIHVDGQDVITVEKQTVAWMDNQVPNWRDPTMTGTTAIFAVLDFNPSAPQIPTQRSVWLYPFPGELLTGGLVVDYKAATLNYLVRDTTALPLQASKCLEPLVEGTCAALASRIPEFQSTYAVHLQEARHEGAKIRLKTAQERSSDRSSMNYFV